MTTDRSDVERARAELAATVDAITYKLNVPKRTAERVQRLRDDNPLALVGLAVGVAVAVGGAVWGIVAAVRR
ncbi:DUF3618 domain-containing protein [Leifsonia sp. TF02-11]|uniref:DUF3618 domain-containing protein n=1 Tax=Leifsonia sp. TF02-11 TaxID=2815212 RepID=UPI001AA1AC48|nr:DUF3618 domain-containing protein [Leifsonia sp. TF02-11]MBN9630193.1 DUF3618 domain-containing protein [Actinomycetota bacterium]MBO1737633.1 DUF3618 domain-containing protein [Leifsonia sp. TF02-11]